MSWKNRASLNLERNNPANIGVYRKDVNHKAKYFPDLLHHRMSFGTPSYPSPLDRIRSGNQERKSQFGISSINNASFEGNQSFPKTSKTKISVPARKLNLENFKGPDLNDVSFTTGFQKGPYNHLCDKSFDMSPLDKSMNHSGHVSPREVSHLSSREVSHLSSREASEISSMESSMNASSGERSMNASSGERSIADGWSFYKHIGGYETGHVLPTTMRNPNKALCTINSKTSEILIANEMACELFGFEETELIGLMLKDLVKLKPREQAAIMESHLEPSGDVVNLTGKVVDAVDKTGLILPVSIWVKKLETSKEPRCLVVMEPVERNVAIVRFAADGTIVSCDDQLAYIHGFHNRDDLQGTHIKDLIPAFKLPVPGERLAKDVKKQRATGRTKDGSNFPLSVAVEMTELDDEDEVATQGHEDIYRGVVWVFANISGLITFLPDGTIHNINDNFSLMLFGFKGSEVIGKNISMLIPDFYEILDLVDDGSPLPNTDDDKLSIHSKDSGRNSSRSSSKGTSRTDSDDPGISLSLGSGNPATLVGFGLHEPGVTSTPNKPTVSDSLAKRLSTNANEKTIDPEVAESLPPPAELKINAVTSLDHSSPNHSTISTSSTETLLTARDTTCTNTSTSSNKSLKIAESGKSPKMCGNECSTGRVEDKNSKSEVIVFKIDGVSGQYEVEATSSAAKLKDESPKTAAENKNYSNMCQTFGSSTPVSKTIQKLEKSDILNSPCLSDIMRLNSQANSPGFDSFAIEGGDELEYSDSEVSNGELEMKRSKLNTTDDLIAATREIVTLDDVKGNKDMVVSHDMVVSRDMVVSCDMVVSRASDVSDQIAVSDEGNVSDILNDAKSEANLSCGGKDNADNDIAIDILKHSPSVTKEQASIVEVLDADKCAKSEGEGEKSAISETEDIDESLLHRSSIHQFLNSRCNKSRNLEDSGSILRQNNSHNINVSDSSTNNSPAMEIYYPKDIETPDFKIHHDNSSTSNLDFSDFSNEGYSPSLMSFEKHEKGVRYVTKSRKGSKSSDYSSNGTMMFPEGSFQGQCQHRDQSLLGIVFQIKRVQLDDGNEVYCMWVSRDPEEPAECGRSYANLTLESSMNSTMDRSNYSVGEALIERAQSASKDPLDEDEDPLVPVLETEEDRAIKYGPYCKHYDTLHTIGKGAFGFVRLAERMQDKTQVVVKFIRRGKVFSDCWVQDSRYGRMPLEVSILHKLDHPNIVKVLDVFDNAEFIQMVMEKHGSGMDLFEFIDRSPNMDECLASFIFRQMVSAVSYLHRKNILHRDIKDENVIVNEQFHIKLIDFGAVAFLNAGTEFATFCGTLEYCSPEVLLGNKYRGPELEVWSLGVTLYTLVFGENPFFDVEETIKCVLKPPFPVTSELMMLIFWLLHPDSARRASVTSVEKNCWVTQHVDISKYSWSQVLPNCEFHGNTASDNRPDTPPVADIDRMDERAEDSEMDELKCNLFHKLNLS